MSDDRYEGAKKERQQCLDKILESDAHKKIVVAGPGTGKTHLFKELIRGKNNCLTLTFVNSLVGDLSLDLCGMSEVRTLHGYARSILTTATKTDIALFPKLPHVMKTDAEIFLGEDIDFEKLFHTRDDKNKHLEFYRDRRRYYAHYGFTDIIFSAVTFFEGRKEKLPTYNQVLVDEFQDFNQLEVSLIDLLSESSPILIAGDDDQALYDFKNASADHIRTYHGDGSGYETFNLPFCSRCTNVIVDAANDIIRSAKEYGLLAKRIDKPYRYFPSKEKDAHGDQHGYLIYKQAYAKQIPWFVGEQVLAMARDVRGPFTVLVITPTSGQCREITDKLRKKGFENVSHTSKDRLEPALIDGLKLITKDPASNLGWRIVAERSLSEAKLAGVLQQAGNDNPIVDSLESGLRDQIREHAGILRRAVGGQVRSREALNQLAEQIGVSADELVFDEVVRLGTVDTATIDGAIRRIPIKVTTVQSSKGLAADLVLIVNFDDQYFIRDKNRKTITDKEVCSFLVALTRARRKMILVSSGREEPTFLRSIGQKRIQRV